MAKFSILNPLSHGKSAPNTVNFEGGRAFTQTAKLELVSVLVTTFLEDEFYRTEKQTTEKIRELITKVGDPRFELQIFSRRRRLVPHLADRRDRERPPRHAHRPRRRRPECIRHIGRNRT